MPLPLIIAGVGALAGIAGNIYASNKASKARKEQQAMIDAENQRNESWFNSEYYKSQLDRTENAHALQKAQEFFRDRANMDAKTAAVTGATPESVAASRKSYANAYSNLVGQVAAGASAERDRIRAMYEARRQNIFGMKYGMYGDQVEQYGNLGANSASLATNSA
ncbi:MAG: hypothetical protein LBK58_05990, partial [Prevotellaceae bacterium]|nr:hypothetical protein [Prevotellaceae bacterium]